MKHSTSLITCLAIFILFQVKSQTTYTTVINGVWNAPATWDVGVPPTPLPNGDSIIINHTIAYNGNQVIWGVMIINSIGTINGGGANDLKVGKNAILMGELINYGTLNVRDLEVKPGNGCVPTIVLPIIHNYGTITTTDDLHIGNNCGAGSFYNHIGGKVYVNDRIHLDNFLCNADSMFITTSVKNHGGTIDCCGYIETPLFDIDPNTGRPGTFGCINVCSPLGGPPVYNVANTDYADLIDADTSTLASDVIFSPNTTECGFVLLPIELIEFNAISKNAFVSLSWATASELNNDYFAVQRSENSIDWETIEIIDGLGTSIETNFYSTSDRSPIIGVSYYRLKQVDFDGMFSYSSIVSVTVHLEDVSVFPNPSNGTFTVNFGSDIISSCSIRISNLLGEVIYCHKGENNSSSLMIEGDFPKGTYLAAITVNGTEFLKRIVIR